MLAQERFIKAGSADGVGLRMDERLDALGGRVPKPVVNFNAYD